MREYQLRPIKFLWQLLNRTISEAKVYILGYRSYTALLNQGGTGDPVPTILDNTLGNIVWTRDGVGEYTGTLTGAFGDGSKLFMPYVLIYTVSDRVAVAAYDSPDTVILSRFDSGLPVDGFLINTQIEIRVYN
jgi:hypothetical protein